MHRPISVAMLQCCTVGVNSTLHDSTFSFCKVQAERIARCALLHDTLMHSNRCHRTGHT